MADDNTNASVDTGSAGSAAAGSNDVGQTGTGETVPKSQYDDLFSKMGKMGDELGVYRQYYSDTKDFIGLLEEHPEIEQAILSGKFDAEMAKAVLDGRVTQEEATAVADAHQQVKNNMGEEDYKNASAEDISAKVEKLVESKLDAALKPIIETSQKKIEDMSSRMEVQKRVSDAAESIREFISSTPDFGQYSADVLEKMESSPGLSIIEAYERVKAHDIVSRAGQEQNSQNAQSMKDVAANARGGNGSRSGGVITGDARNKFIKMDATGGFGLG